jgi:hypothetical protein
MRNAVSRMLGVFAAVVIFAFLGGVPDISASA